MSRIKKSVEERLLEGIHILESACWVWSGADSGNGYGRISVKGKTRATHIVAWELMKGERVPEGMVLDHQCLNRRCCTPEHLQPIPGIVNTLIGEGPTAKNALKTHCLRGHEFNEENTIVRVRNGRKSRECRACRKERSTGVSIHGGRERRQQLPTGCGRDECGWGPCGC